ncbi:hypothetical protein [Halovivax sp.]|uniref:hypothetical protein n=1 Tax=Halovivax sp. TaxID=1935978 RepID=UPI0025B8008C|nr:hypothetical protein [Halovivax sp.]
MGNPLLEHIGAGMMVFARYIVVVAERLAFRNPEDATLRRTTIPAARLEGLLAVAFARRGNIPPHLGVPIGIAGVAMIVAPRTALRIGLRLAYRDPDRIEVESWVGPATRIAGVTHLLLALRVLRGRRE